MELSDWFITDKKPLQFIVWGLIMIAVSGMFFALVYFFIDQTETAFDSIDCVLVNNAFGDSCSDIWDMVLSPFFALKSVMVYLSMFFIFILVLGMLLSGYNSGTRPWMLGILVVVEVALTYGSFYLANLYRTFLDNEVIRTALTDFSVYNKIMMNFPWFVFIVSLFSLALGIVNWQKTKVNAVNDELNY